MSTSDVQEPDELEAHGAGPVSVSIRNLERGQVIEAVVAGELDAESAAALGRRLHTLAANRQPMTLCVDLAAVAEVPERLIDAFTAAAATLDGFGGALVLRDADPAFEAVVPPERLGRSLRFERSDGLEPT